MDVINAEQVCMPYASCTPLLMIFQLFFACFHFPKARIAEEAGACAVMALERVPADIRAVGGVARMASVRFRCCAS
jgi:hypothetical protein